VGGGAQRRGHLNKNRHNLINKNTGRLGHEGWVGISSVCVCVCVGLEAICVKTKKNKKRKRKAIYRMRGFESVLKKMETH